MLSNQAKKYQPRILKVIEELYEKERRKITPLYPVNKKTGKIELPNDVIADVEFFLLVGNKSAAVKPVAELTGASLRMSALQINFLDQASTGGIKLVLVCPAFQCREVRRCVFLCYNVVQDWHHPTFLSIEYGQPADS